VLHYWFPPGETLGHEFIQPRIQLTPERRTVPNQLQLRIDAIQNGAAAFEGSPADYYALREALLRIESGKLARARDCFRRNYFLAQNREGTFTSFLLALLMTDVQEARESLEVVRRLDPERMRVLSQLGVYDTVDSLSGARSNLKTSQVRRSC
jgi:hypothetical protein